MYEINRRALTVPGDQLVTLINEANVIKNESAARKDARYGASRVKISSYMENTALFDLFGFDMNDIYQKPNLALDVELRAKLFWLDNSWDDQTLPLTVSAGNHYFSMTLFGLRINYRPDGVPVFARHEMAGDPDLSRLKPFDFETTGEMPLVHQRYREMKRISAEKYKGEVKIQFPPFSRGPLDIAVQLRGYENFIGDCSENPDFVHSLMSFIVSGRNRYNKRAADFRGGAAQAPFIADDWVNVPFISPDIFGEFIVPAYRAVRENEGAVTGFHTCGAIGPVVIKLLETLPEIKTLDVSGWNDITELDKILDKGVAFQVSLINSFVLCASPEEHRRKLEEIKKIARGREVSLVAQSIVKLFDSFFDSVYAMNRFIDLAHNILNN